jgi:peptide deformylase
MAVRPLTFIGNPVLRTRTHPVTEVTEEIRRLIRDLYETMHAANGVGLAANQVGVGLRIAVLGVPSERDDEITHLTMINPEFSDPRGTQNSDEGCLSIPGLYEPLRRAKQVTLRACNEKLEPYAMQCEGLFARAVQHEVDHLNGLLFVDRLSALKRGRLRRELRAIEEEYGSAAAGAGRSAVRG